MREERGDLWTIGADADAVVITTNGAVRGDGAAVMGRGCALEAKERFPGIEFRLGDRLTNYGNHLFVFQREGTPCMGARDERCDPDPWMCACFDPSLVTFPVKHHWKQAADPELIRVSVLELVVHAGWEKWGRVVLPRPGCGNGRLRWEDVKPILDEHLDDRFTCVTF